MTTSDVAALVGAITGPAGLLLALLLYFRDRAVVTVALQWDMETFGAGADPSKTYFVVTIRNIGRRPIYLSHAHLILPKGADPKSTHILLGSGVAGVTLAEGAAPHIVHADQEDIDKYAHVWWKLRATVIDAAGKHYHSKWPIESPSWARDTPAPFGALAFNRLRNRMNELLP